MEPYSKAISGQPQSSVLTKTGKDDDKGAIAEPQLPRPDYSNTTTPDSVPLMNRALSIRSSNPAFIVNTVPGNTQGPAKYEVHGLSYSESSRRFLPHYTNFDEGSIECMVQAGNQKLISLRNNKTPYESKYTEEKQQKLALQHKFDYIAEFLTKHSEIKYIVDIGCGDAEKSLILQNHLNQLGFNITVCPVDILCQPQYRLPINVIPAQEIKEADKNTAFIAIRAFTDLEEYYLVKGGDKEFYIKTLIQNNPGCFVLASEDPLTSRPNYLIPMEMAYTKRFGTNDYDDDNHEEIHELKKKLDAINSTIDKFPAPKYFWPWLAEGLKQHSLYPKIERETLFFSYLDAELMEQGVERPDSQRWAQHWGRPSGGYFNWHVYRQKPPQEALSWSEWLISKFLSK